MPKPTMMVLDYETALLDGTASVDFYRPDFRVTSAAFSWRDSSGSIKSVCLLGEDVIRTWLRSTSQQQIPVVVHNASFEYGVTKCRFPELELNWHADTMRLVQVLDNGGISQEKTIEQEALGTLPQGYSLTNCTTRWLPKSFHNHKEPYYSYLREHHKIPKKQEGANLHLLPIDMLQKYNVADTEVTLMLYETTIARCDFLGYDWRMDHSLYLESCKLLSDSRAMGVEVNRVKLTESIKSLESSIESLKTLFYSKYKTEIDEIESDKLTALKASYKTEKGRLGISLEDYQFNVNSTKDKELLFVTKLGVEPKIVTPTGKPSFKRQFLGQFGEGGLLLEKRGTLSITIDQCKKLLQKSEYDNKWHIDLKAVGTVTGRFAGAGGLNIQAMARREPLLMECIVPREGHVFVSVDLSAGEPTVTTEFSRDPYYKAAVFDMVVKEPYYDDKNVLLIDDIYLMGMSVSPMGKNRLLRAFYEEKFDGLPFSQAWVVNSDLIKTTLKKERAFHKILMLGLERFMGPKHMCEDAAKAGYSLTMKEAKAFSKAYWNLFSVIKDKATRLSKKYEKDGSIENMFGYRMLPNKSYQAWAWLIQSMVSGLINVLCIKFFTVCKEARFVTVIHDEIIFEIPIENKESVNGIFNKCVNSLNEDLGWSVKVRSGWKEGDSFYTAK